MIVAAVLWFVSKRSNKSIRKFDEDASGPPMRLNLFLYFLLDIFICSLTKQSTGATTILVERVGGFRVYLGLNLTDPLLVDAIP